MPMRLFTTIILGLLFALPALPFSIVPDVKDTVMLEEVTISSIKQTDKLYQSPVASTVIGADEAERLNIVTLKGLSDIVPNFYVPDYGSRITSSIYVRGLGARMDQPVIGFIVDNVPFMNKDSYDFDIADIYSVEMLRGPQSTLYGRNTMGGLINISTLSPLRWQGFRGKLDYGSANSWSAQAGWYGLLKPGMGLAAVAGFTSSDGFFKNELTGKNLDKERQLTARLKFDWNISSDFVLRNTFSLSRLRQGGYPYEYLQTGKIAYNDTCFYHRFTLNDGLTLRWILPKVILSSITSLQYINDNMTLDQDFLPESYFTLVQKKQETALTQDFVARSSTPIGRYSWLTGLFGFYRHCSMQAPVVFKETGIKELIVDHRNSANPAFPIKWLSDSFPLNSDFEMPGYGIAVYHRSELDFNPVKVTLGLRLDYERSTLDYHSYCSTAYNMYYYPTGSTTAEYLKTVAIDINDRGKLSNDFLELLPMFGVVWDLNNNNICNLYLNITKGYKAGGFNTQMFSDVLQQSLMGLMGIASLYDPEEIVSYKPEKSWNFEVGAHYVSPESSFEGSASLFYILCRDQQLTMFPDGTTTGRIMTNAGKTRSFGGELQGAYNSPFGLRISVGYGYTNAKFQEFNNGLINMAGKYIPYAPSHTLSAEFSWMRQFSDNGFIRSLSLEGGLRGTGPIYWNDDNSRMQKFYAVVNASATLSGKNWSLMLHGDNITDTRYYTFYFISMNNEFVQRAKPALWGVTLRLYF